MTPDDKAVNYHACITPNGNMEETIVTQCGRLFHKYYSDDGGWSEWEEDLKLPDCCMPTVTDDTSAIRDERGK